MTKGTKEPESIVDELKRTYAGLTCSSDYEIFKIELYFRAMDDMTIIDSLSPYLKDVIKVVPEHISGCTECNSRYTLETSMDEYFDLIAGRGLRPKM